MRVENNFSRGIPRPLESINKKKIASFLELMISNNLVMKSKGTKLYKPNKFFWLKLETNLLKIIKN